MEMVAVGLVGLGAEHRAEHATGSLVQPAQNWASRSGTASRPGAGVAGIALGSALMSDVLCRASQPAVLTDRRLLALGRLDGGVRDGADLSIDGALALGCPALVRRGRRVLGARRRDPLGLALVAGRRPPVARHLD
jgi:hypothetical protein